jgi:hypothetical protein
MRTASQLYVEIGHPTYPYEPWRQDTPKKISGKVKEAKNDKEWLKRLK